MRRPGGHSRPVTEDEAASRPARPGASTASRSWTRGAANRAPPTSACRDGHDTKPSEAPLPMSYARHPIRPPGLLEVAGRMLKASMSGRSWRQSTRRWVISTARWLPRSHCMTRPGCSNSQDSAVWGAPRWWVTSEGRRARCSSSEEIRWRRSAQRASPQHAVVLPPLEHRNDFVRRDGGRKQNRRKDNARGRDGGRFSG